MAISEASYMPLGWNGHPDKKSRLRMSLAWLAMTWKEVALVMLATLTLGLTLMVIHQGTELESLPFRYSTFDPGNGPRER